MPSNKLCGGIIQTAAGSATAAEMEPTETYRVSQQRQNENRQRNQQRPRRERKINPGAGGDAFAAFELQPAGVIVAEHGKNAGDDMKPASEYSTGQF